MATLTLLTAPSSHLPGFRQVEFSSGLRLGGGSENQVRCDTGQSQGTSLVLDATGELRSVGPGLSAWVDGVEVEPGHSVTLREGARFELYSKTAKWGSVALGFGAAGRFDLEGFVGGLQPGTAGLEPVLADALMEHGDERGERMRRGEPSNPGEEQRWLGPFGRVVAEGQARVTWKAGFLDEVRLQWTPNLQLSGAIGLLAVSGCATLLRRLHVWVTEAQYTRHLALDYDDHEIGPLIASMLALGNWPWLESLEVRPINVSYGAEVERAVQPFAPRLRLP